MFLAKASYGTYLIKISASGDSLSSEKFCNDCTAESMKRTKDNGYVIAGIRGYWVSNVHSDDDAFLAVTDSLGWLDRTGIMDILQSKGSVNLFPNPFYSNATLMFPNSSHETYTMDIYNSIGKKIFTSSQIKDNKILISKEFMPKAGLYIYHLYNASGIQYRDKFIAE